MAASTAEDVSEASSPQPSKRVRLTDDPCIVTMQKMLRGQEGILSLAQGIVHWSPPAAVMESVAAAVGNPECNAYCSDEGLPALCDALKEKLRAENGLSDVEVMVTAGANQAYANTVVALLDAEDGAVLFAPFYFNHKMALDMTGGHATVVLGKVTDEFLPDVDWLESRLVASNGGPRIRMVTVVNPCNPTGVMIPPSLLQRLSVSCAKSGVWLVVDNTYEHFEYEREGQPPHICLSGDHVVNIFSFSKAYGMMGWRIGYLAYPHRLHSELLKAQDTIAICPAVVSQKAALAALSVGRSWVTERVRGLSANRIAVREAVEAALGKGSVFGGSGAIYFLVRLPVEDDLRVVQWLNKKHKICVIPGSACGAPGTIRVSYANMLPSRCEEAAARLKEGLAELAKVGAEVLKD